MSPRSPEVAISLKVSDRADTDMALLVSFSPDEITISQETSDAPNDGAKDRRSCSSSCTQEELFILHEEILKTTRKQHHFDEYDRFHNRFNCRNLKTEFS